MLIRMPFLLVWNIVRNVLRFPFVLLSWVIGLFGDDDPKYVRVHIKNGLARWQESKWYDFWRDEPTDLTIPEWKETLEKLGKNKAVAGIVCDVESLRTSLPIIQELRALFDDFRAKGKKVVLVFRHHLGMGELVLSASADTTLLQPSASVTILAPSMEGLYYAGLLKQVGVEMVMERVGEHKNAPEAMTRSFPSPTGRADIEDLLDMLLRQLLPPIAEAQGIEVKALYARLADGILSPEEALEAGLIDAIRYADRVDDYLKAENPNPFEYPEHPFDPSTQALEAASAAPTAKDEPGVATASVVETNEDTEASPAENTKQSEAAAEMSASADATDTTEATKAGHLTEVTEVTEVTETTDTPEVAEVTEVAEVAKEEKPAAAAPVIAEPEVAVSTASTESKEQKQPEASDEYDTGEDDDEDSLLVDLDDFSVDGLTWFRWSPMRRKPKIAVIPITGTIMDGSSPTSMGDAEALRDPILEAIQAAKEDGRVKGVIAYINSRGGSGTASEAIWHALHQLDTKKPVVAYLDDYAASGGYYIACGARHIIASPWCITGSIGVFGGKPVVEKLLQRLQLGVMRVGDTTGSRLFSIYSKPTPHERARYRAQMAVFYERFVLRVADNRKRTFDEIDPIAGGRVYIARDAFDIGLVDAIGGFQDAIDKVEGLVEQKDLKLDVLKTSPRASLVEIMRSQAASPSIGRASLPQVMSLLGARFGSQTGEAAQWVDALLALTGGERAALVETMQVLHLLARGQVTAWYDGHLKLR